MTDQTHTPMESVADAHRNSNLVILRFSSVGAAHNSKRRHSIARNLGMRVTIVSMGLGALKEN